jgi:thiosulfate/3-mercaptopyruvate sulfurtransferase
MARRPDAPGVHHTPAVALISPEALIERLGSPTLRLADVRWSLGAPGRGREAYAAGHLPGAVFVDLDRDLSGPHGPGRHPLPEPRAFTERMSALGFGERHSIVAYDDASGTVAARLWWMLDALGHPDVAVLDGGLGAWLAAGGHLTVVVPAHPPTPLNLDRAWPRVIEREEVVARLGALDLVDLRAGERYRGEIEPVDAAAGHIPTARSLPATGLLDERGRLLPATVLAARLDPDGSAEVRGTSHAERVPADAERVMSCGSGVTACFGALAHRVAGLADPLVYPGSFSDWSASGMPIATGPEPGEPGA